jgi:hypothetical protein
MISGPLRSHVRSCGARLRSPELLCLLHPESAKHVVQFYEDDTVVIEGVSELAARALSARSSAVIIATESHLHRFDAKLLSFGLDLAVFRNRGLYLTSDAAEALSQFVINGSPDEAAFDRVIGGAMREAVKHSANRFVFAFGEMVALLCADNNPSGAIRLEQLWNRLMRRQRFSLYCAYPLSSLDTEQNVDSVLRICDEHALTVPAERSL